MKVKRHQDKVVVAPNVCFWEAACPADVNTCLEPLLDQDVIDLVV